MECPGESPRVWSRIGLEWSRHLFAIFTLLEALFAGTPLNEIDSGEKKAVYTAVEFICGQFLDQPAEANAPPATRLRAGRELR